MKFIKLQHFLIACLTFIGSNHVFAQENAGSISSDNGYMHIASNTYHIEMSESLFIGPNAVWQIDGVVEIYSKSIWIAPTAKISGSGSLIIRNPGDNPRNKATDGQATKIDGNNGGFIDLNIVLANNKGLALVDLPGYEYEVGVVINDLEKRAALRIGKSIDLRVDGANVFLKGHDFELGTFAEILGYNYRRMVVTDNLLQGHLIKNYLNTAQSFVFPVGIKVEDYTPAILRPRQVGSKVFVSINDYRASSLKFNTSETDLGMDRVWNIYAETPMQMDYTLIHNKSTEGVAFIDESVRIIQNADAGNWIGDVTSMESAGVHSRDNISTKIVNTLSGTWFTKRSLYGPTAQNDFERLTYGQQKVIQALDNDKPGSSAIVVEKIMITRQPVNGRVDLVGNSFVYIPNDKFVGGDDFDYVIVDENGLRSVAKVSIVVEPRELLIPNVITPNGDHKNENFTIIGKENYDRLELRIINRWGNEVYVNSHYDDNWSGRGLNEGTYYYILSAKKGNETRQFKGYVLIKKN